MPSIIVKHVHGHEIPAQWIKGIEQNLDQTFTLILRPEGNPKIIGEKACLKRRNRIFRMLEGTSGRESSEEWIEHIRSARTASHPKAVLE